MESPYFADYGSMFLILVSVGVCVCANVVGDRFYSWGAFASSLSIILFGILSFFTMYLIIVASVIHFSKSPEQRTHPWGTGFVITRDMSFAALFGSFIYYIYLSSNKVRIVRSELIEAVARGQSPLALARQAETMQREISDVRRLQNSALISRRDRIEANRQHQIRVASLEQQLADLRQRRNAEQRAIQTLQREIAAASGAATASHATASHATASHATASHATASTASASGSSNEDPRAPSSRRGSRRQMLRRERTKKR
jgi:hypothetical protein